LDSGEGIVFTAASQRTPRSTEDTILAAGLPVVGATLKLLVGVRESGKSEVVTEDGIVKLGPTELSALGSEDGVGFEARVVVWGNGFRGRKVVGAAGSDSTDFG
jgi:hypothetical protein